MLRLRELFKDGLVLQQGKEIRIQGQFSSDIVFKATIKAVLKDKNKKILTDGSMNIDTGSKNTIADFTLRMPGITKGGPFVLEVFDAMHPADKVVINDVYAGEVWLAGGQDNMCLTMKHTDNAEEIINATSQLNIRYFTVSKPEGYIGEDADKKTSEWIKVDQTTLGDMSGVAYYFAQTLHTKMSEDTMIGIVECSACGASILSWMSEEKIKSTVDGTNYYNGFMNSLFEASAPDYQEAMRSLGNSIRDYQKKLKALMAEKPYITYGEIGDRIGSAPVELPMLKTDIRRPCVFYNEMLLTIAGFNFKGVIFYQGEADCEERCLNYGTLFKQMIEEWRLLFEEKKLPFVFVQLPMFTDKQHRFMEFDAMNWPILREQQAMVADEVPNTYMAVVTDCGEFDNLLPGDKRTPGTRMGLLALKHTYRYRSVNADEPHLVDIRRSNNRIEVSFSGDFTTINCAGSNTFESGFEMADEHGKFIPARASIDFDGRTVILDCPELEFPTKVRYAYFSYGKAALLTDTGLAVGPFNNTIDKGLGSVI